MLQTKTLLTGANGPRSGGLSCLFSARAEGLATVKAVVDVLLCSTTLLALLLCTPVRAEEPPPPADTLAASSDPDGRVVDLVESLGLDVIDRPSHGGSGGAHALVSTLNRSRPLLLWVDSARSSISLLRADDGRLLSRQMARVTFSDAPYAAAVIATELVELMQETPLTRRVNFRRLVDHSREQLSGREVAPNDSVAHGVVAQAPRRSAARVRARLEEADLLARLVPSRHGARQGAPWMRQLEIQQTDRTTDPRRLAQPHEGPDIVRALVERLEGRAVS